jgi:hypothetical protein
VQNKPWHLVSELLSCKKTQKKRSKSILHLFDSSPSKLEVDFKWSSLNQSQPSLKKALPSKGQQTSQSNKEDTQTQSEMFILFAEQSRKHHHIRTYLTWDTFFPS